MPRPFIFALLAAVFLASPGMGLFLLALFIPNWVADATKGR